MRKNVVDAKRIEGDNGISIEFLGRGGIGYREGTHEMLVDSENLVQGSRYDLVLYTGSVRRWKPPYADELISDAKRGQIIARICELLRSSGIKVDLD
jgi:hypothetical protein